MFLCKIAVPKCFFNIYIYVYIRNMAVFSFPFYFYVFLSLYLGSLPRINEACKLGTCLAKKIENQHRV